MKTRQTLMENWRSISLLNVDYKLLSLILAKRFKTGLTLLSMKYNVDLEKGVILEII